MLQPGEVFYPAIAGIKFDEIEDGMRCESLTGRHIECLTHRRCQIWIRDRDNFGRRQQGGDINSKTPINAVTIYTNNLKAYRFSVGC